MNISVSPQIDHANPLRVLVVEDIELTAEHLCELIQRLERTVAITTVATENAAVAAIANLAPDIIVLDLRLKQGSGFTVLRKAAALRPKPFIVVVTNFALPEYRKFALLSGADYFLDKALNLEALPEILNSFDEHDAPPSMQ